MASDHETAAEYAQRVREGAARMTEQGTAGYTAGPWQVDDADYPLIINDESGRVIALVPDPADQVDETIRLLDSEPAGNARLIAAAPELVELAEWIDNNADHEQDCPRKFHGTAECQCIRYTAAALLNRIAGE